MIPIKVAFFAASLCFVGVFSETPTQSSIHLTKENFASMVQDKNFLVLFYSPESDLSKKFLPTFEKLAEKFNVLDGLLLGTVNCVNSNDLCDAVAKEAATSLEVILYQKYDDSVRFNGVRSVDGLAKFLVKHLGDDVLGNIIEKPEKLEAINTLTDDTFADHVSIGQHFVKFYAPWCGHCQRLAPTWDELASALEYDPTVSISKVDCTLYRPVCQDFDVKGYPTLLWIVDGKKVEKYTGARSLSDLKAYVEKTAGVSSIEEEPKSLDFNQHATVLQLTTDSFNHAIEKGVTFVKFFAPWCGHCKRMAPTWDELAVKFVGNANVKIAKVDCTLSDNKDLCSLQDVNGFPTIFLYKDGEKVTEYNGSRSLDDLFDFVSQHVTARDEL